MLGVGLSFSGMAAKMAKQAMDIKTEDKKVGRDLALRFITLVHDPWPPGAPRDTSTMVRGFSVRDRQDGADVINPVEYWPYVNFGTIKMEKRPFVELTLQRMDTEGHTSKIVANHLRRIFS